MTLKELGHLSNNTVDWVEFVNRIYTEINSTVRVSNEEMAYVVVPKFYAVMPQILSQTPNRVIANYLGWAVVNDLYSLYNMSDNQTNLDNQCLRIIDNTLPAVVTRLYVDSSFSVDDKDKVIFI